ncbi:calponin-2-like [Anguilla anguilla]|uniref:calponin-2-like n=1 Tax=Anguilla anguilla TaxID=7936 RepID=UPI0015AFA5DC|nr:calponin-2-like [Anguilla anguilla]
MSGTQFNKGPTYGLSAEVRSKIAQKYDARREEELRLWIEEVTGSAVGEDFQKGLKNGTILCELINKLQPGSVRKISRSSQNWHQLENLSNFIKAITAYGLKPHDIFEANDLFESGNMTQVQTTLLALAGMAKTKGLQSCVDIGVKYADRQERSFNEEKMKAGQCVIGLQMGTNKCASQAGMNAYGTRRHLYDPKAHILPPMDNSTISLQMGTNKGASQAGMTAPGTRRAIYDQKLGTDKCDNSTMSLQMGYAQGANQSGQNFGLGRQIYSSKYCPRSEEEQELNGAESGGLVLEQYRDDGYQGYQDDEQQAYPGNGHQERPYEENPEHCHEQDPEYHGDENLGYHDNQNQDYEEVEPQEDREQEPEPEPEQEQEQEQGLEQEVEEGLEREQEPDQEPDGNTEEDKDD